MVASCTHIPVSARVEHKMSEKVHPSGRWKVKARFKRRALTDEAVLEYTEQLVIVTVPPVMRSPPPCTHRSTTGHSIGAMEVA